MSEHRPATWGGGGKKSVRAQSVAQPSQAAPEPEPEATEATDAAKALAAQHDIDLAFVPGTGQDGRITKEDVAALIEPSPEPEPAEPIPDEAEAVVAEPLPAVEAEAPAEQA